MKFTIDRGALLKALTHVHNIVERRSTIPILANVLAIYGKLNRGLFLVCFSDRNTL